MVSLKYRLIVNCADWSSMYRATPELNASAFLANAQRQSDLHFEASSARLPPTVRW